MSREMLINSTSGHECRIAIVDNNKLEELYIERASNASRVGNIYKGRITNVEQSIQAAFVDFGLSKNGFLHISDLHPQYFPKGQRAASEAVGCKTSHRSRPPMQDCLKRGQEVVVQMTKEGIGTKGPTLTTYLSIPGRMLVMMPNMTKLGVSRKVEDDNARASARQALSELKLPKDMGFIVRTAGVDRSKRELQRDLNYLLRLWKAVNKQIGSTPSPAEIYRESDLVIRTIRDIYNSSIERIICDQKSVAERVNEFLQLAMPRTKHSVEFYTGNEGLFYESGLEDEIEKVYSRRVDLPSGGSIVIDSTEALVAIDVNSGKSRDHRDAESSALNTNLEAAREIALQLRLRDLGGVVVLDFIDMREEKNRRTIEKTLRDEMKDDRAKSKLTRINAFGTLQMTRQRLGPPLQRSIYRPCSHCDGMGIIKSEESQALVVMRLLQRICANDNVHTIEVSVSAPVAEHLLNIERREIARMERETGNVISIIANSSLTGGEVEVACSNSRGSKVAWDSHHFTKDKHPKLKTQPLKQTHVELDDEDEKDGNDEQALEVQEQQQPEKENQKEEVNAEGETKSKKRRGRRGRRGGRRHKKSIATTETDATEDGSQQQADKETPATQVQTDSNVQADVQTNVPPDVQGNVPAEAKPQEGQSEGEHMPDAAPAKKRRRRGGRKRSAKKAAQGENAQQAVTVDTSQQAVTDTGKDTGKEIAKDAGGTTVKSENSVKPTDEPAHKPTVKPELDEQTNNKPKTDEQTKPARPRRARKASVKKTVKAVAKKITKTTKTTATKESESSEVDSDTDKKATKKTVKKATKKAIKKSSRKIAKKAARTTIDIDVSGMPPIDMKPEKPKPAPKTRQPKSLLEAMGFKDND